MLFIGLILQLGLHGLNITVIFETELQPVIRLKFEMIVIPSYSGEGYSVIPRLRYTSPEVPSIFFPGL